MSTFDPQHLKNRYYIVRHGRSKANEAGIILSTPADGTAEWGLTAEGIRQAEQAAESCGLPPETVIYSSDFCRAKETAEIIHAGINASAGMTLSTNLRERFFGSWDKTPDSNYHEVWKGDRISGDNTENNVESPNQVFSRIIGLISDLEQQHTGQVILLVSHGDALQILQTGFAGIPAHQHRSLPHINTAEIRCLNDKDSDS